MGYFKDVTPETAGISSKGILNFLDRMEESQIELHSFMVIRRIISFPYMGQELVRHHPSHRMIPSGVGCIYTVCISSKSVIANFIMCSYLYI